MSEPIAPQPMAAVPRFDASFCKPGARPLVLAAAILASAMGFIDGTMVAIAIPAMRSTLGASLVQAQWIANAYMLALSALILTGGAMGDRLGVARVFAAGIALFMAGSLACALAPGADILIAARAAKGIGAALMVPGSLAILSRAYPRDVRGRAIGAWAAASALTTALGPPLAGAVITFGGPEAWRWLFAMNLPLGLVALALLARAVDRDRGRPDTDPDLPGTLLASLGLGLLAWALTGIEGGRDVTASLAATAAGIAAMVAFALWESRTTHPMMPPRLFRSRTFSVTNIVTFLLYVALTAMLFFLPMTVIATWGVPEATAALAFVPVAGLIALLSQPAGHLSDRVGPGPLIAGGSALVALALALLALAIHTERFWTGVIPLMALMGLGMGLVVAPLSVAVMGAVSDEDSGAASGINNAVARTASLVAVAAMGSVATLAYARAGGTLGFGLPGSDPLHHAATDAGFAAVAWVSAALAALSAVLALWGVGRVFEPHSGS